MSQDNLQDSGQRGPLGDYDPLYPGQLGRSLYHPEMDYNLDLIGQIIQGYRVMGTNADGSININDDTEKVLKLYKVKVTDTLLIGAGAVVDDLVWVPTDTIGSGGGPQGDQGDIGFQGFQGNQGFQGLGFQGNQGDIGPTGVQGPTGIKGDQGFQGNDGPIGSQGSQGLGFQGNQGDIGPTGVQGTDGSTGAQGAQGNDGNYVIFNPTQPNSVSSSGAASMEVSFLTQAQYVTVGSILFVENTTSTLSGYVRVTSKTTSPDTFGVEWIETNINSTVGWNATTDVVLTGPEGSQGYQGDQGSQGLGFQGIKGDQGDTGVQGHQGDRGFQGYQGLGFQGIKGDQGDQGNDGPIGSQGFQGIGLQGDQGDQGNRGFQGFQGDKGFQGDQGITGTTGAQGDQGDVGATGAQGFQGITGATGAQGAKGDTGATGAQGFQGITGTAGAQGDQGNIGTTGAQGFQGITGTTGAQGFQGITGTTGAQGFQGNVGTTGAQGFQGDVGATGGSSGRTYFFNDSVIEVAGIKQLGLEPTGGAERIVSISAIQNTDTIIESYISEPFDFNSIPGGVQRFFLWASKSALNDDIEIFVQLHITDNAGTVLATAGTSQPVNIGWNSNSTTAVIHETDITFPTTSVAIGQRMKIEVIARNNDNQNHTTRFYTEGAAHYSYVVTSVGAATGAQGFQGDQGPKGDQGFQGITGSTGAQGFQGNVGATGAQGFQGNIGATGAQGDQGNIGATGAQGDQGNVGATGAQGFQGNDGATGAQGDQGNIGATGAQGFQGITGTTGAQGDQGNVGATGAQGDQGIIGATGAQGFQGNDGSAAISNNVNNNVLTATGTSTINGEGQMTFDGSKLLVTTDVVGGFQNTLSTAVIDGGITNVLPEFGWDQQEWVSGEILSAQTSGASVSYGAVVYLENDKMWYNADNTALIPSSSMLGIALNTTTGSGDLDVLLKGFVATEQVEDLNANHGRPMYLRSNIPGGMSDIIPTTVGEYVRIVGYVFQNQTVNGFILRFDPDKTWIEL